MLNPFNKSEVIKQVGDEISPNE